MWRPTLSRPALPIGLATLGLSALLLTAGLSGQAGQAPSTKNGEWPHYTADLRGTKHLLLDQINAGNFNKLEVAWRFKTDSLGTRPEFKLEGTPLMIGGALYTTGMRRAVVRWTRSRASCCGCTAIPRASAAPSLRDSSRAAAWPTGPTAAATTA